MQSMRSAHNQPQPRHALGPFGAYVKGFLEICTRDSSMFARDGFGAASLATFNGADQGAVLGLRHDQRLM